MLYGSAPWCKKNNNSYKADGGDHNVVDDDDDGNGVDVDDDDGDN